MAVVAVPVGNGKTAPVPVSKGARKAMRRDAVRNYLANEKAERAIRRENKREFYRKLRERKAKRYELARQADRVVDELVDLRTRLRQVEDRYPEVNGVLVDITVAVTKRAISQAKALQTAYWTLARTRVLYVDEVKA